MRSLTAYAHQKAKQSFRNSWVLYLMFVPAAVWMICFRLLPIPGILIAFKDYNVFDGFAASPWVGFKHFQQMFTRTRFLNVIVNTLEISLLKIVVLFPLPIILSLMLNEFRAYRYKRIAQTAIYIPHFLSYVIIHGIFTSLLSTQGGLVNAVIVAMGGQPVNFYANQTFRFTLLLTEFYKEAGWNTIVYLAALSAIDQSLYEAAEVDGAGGFRKTWHITLPGILPVVMMMLTLRLGNIMLAGTTQILVMYNPTVYATADVIGTFVYREGVGSGKFSLATAIGLFESVVGFVMIMGTNYISSKVFKRGLW
ncbi:MAG: sugar ABC transporter permease [Clostridiales bacterium]|jgi:putative aldouronate transport system permease protein|nr:sugar ABC transporter permease [Clostridiales bacterium]